MGAFDLARSNPINFKSFLAGGTELAVGNSAYALLGPTMGTVGTTLVLPSVAAPLSVVSTSASDTGQIYIEYLDSDWYERASVVTLTGTTPVIASASALRVNRATYLPGSNVGAINLTIDGVKISAIRAGDGNARVAMYTAPRGQSAWLLNVTISCDSTQLANMRLRAKVRDRPGAFTTAEVIARAEFAPSEVAYPRKIVDLQGGYGTTIWLEAQRTTGGGTTSVSGWMQILAQRLADTDAPGFGS